MPQTIPNGYGVARHLFNLTGRPTNYVATMGYQQPAGGGDFDAGEAAEAIAECWSATGRPFAAEGMVSSYTYLGVDVTEYSAGEPFTGSASRNVAGTGGGGASLPPNCAYLVTKRTNRGGRKGRGRMFLPPILMAENQVDPTGAITDSLNLSIYQTFFDAAIAAQIATDYPPMLLHADLSTPNAITAVTLQRTMATQRRRLR